MAELISIREAARRLGVSDTAVHKSIKSGRVVVHSHNEGNGRPLLDWPDVERRWLANSDVSKRSHVGSQGSKMRAKDAPRVDLATSDRMDEQEVPDSGDTGPRSGRGGGYAQARAAREAIEARIAKIKLDQMTGKVVDAAEVKAQGHALAAAVIASLYNIPDRVSDQIAGMSSAHEIAKLLLTEIDQAVEDLRAQYAAA